MLKLLFLFVYLFFSLFFRFIYKTKCLQLFGFNSIVRNPKICLGKTEKNLQLNLHSATNESFFFQTPDFYGNSYLREE